jgi:hypothetical protein
MVCLWFESANLEYQKKKMEITMALNEYEQEVSKFLRFCGLTAERYPGKDSQRDKKTVDFKVSNDRGDFFYCEQKTLNDPPFQGMNPKKAQDKIKNTLESAFEQFIAVNPKRLVPNILFWKSLNPQLNYRNLCNLIEGRIELFGNDLDLSFYHKRALRYLKIIDMHIWMPPWGTPDVIYTPRDSFTFRRLERVFTRELLEKWGHEQNTPINIESGESLS